MKKRFFYYLLILTLLGGCASVNPKTEVADNTFYCSYPEIRLQLDPRFKYLGELEYQSLAYLAFTGKIFINNRVNFFVDAEGLEVNRIFYIRTSRISGNPRVTYERGLSTPNTSLDTGVAELGKHKYHYYIFRGEVFFGQFHHPIFTGDGMVGGEFHEKRFITKKGYTVRPALSKIFRRITPRATLDIVYLQYSTQSESLELFNKNCGKSFEVLE
jgi:hypothetical protein